MVQDPRRMAPADLVVREDGQYKWACPCGDVGRGAWPMQGKALRGAKIHLQGHQRQGQ